MNLPEVVRVLTVSEPHEVAGNKRKCVHFCSLMAAWRPAGPQRQLAATPPIRPALPTTSAAAWSSARSRRTRATRSPTSTAPPTPTRRPAAAGRATCRATGRLPPAAAARRTPAAASFTYGGTGAYGGAYGGSGPDEALAQAGGASETFSYTKNYTIGTGGNWQVQSGSGGGASGSGWTTATYYGSTPARRTCRPSPRAAAGPSTNLLSGTDTQSGNNDTSYSFQTYAAFNGIDWSETGEKIATGSGGTTDSFSASASGLTFSPPSETGPYMEGVTVPGGSASVTGTSSTSYNYSAIRLP